MTRKTQKQAAPAHASKLSIMTDLLQRPDGATIAQLVDATGWQAHSVRGCMSGALKKRKLTIVSEKTDAGRVYRASKEAGE